MTKSFEITYKSLTAIVLGLLSGCSSEELTVAPRDPISDVQLISTTPSIPFANPELNNIDRVGEAYRLIGFERYRFEPTNPSVLPSHREYLTQSIAILEQAIVWRVSGFQAMVNGTFAAGDWTRAGDNLIDSLNSVSIPVGMESYHESLIDCVLAYRRFFASTVDRDVTSISKDLQSNRDLRTSSNSIREAYHALKSFHWRADDYCQNVFYNVHMGLDPF